jgi:cbb3-type cytochrome oxidase subunit 3
MSTGLLYLAVGLVIAVFVGIFWWIYSRSTKSRARRKQALSSREATDQPWDVDKDDGRGNR